MAQAPAPASTGTGTGEFDRDTAVRPRREPGVHDAHVSAGWTLFGAANGGYLLATAARALGDTLPHPHPFTITAHYLSVTRPGPAVVRSEPVRTGRTLSTGQASLFQTSEDGTEVERLRVLATYGDLDALTGDVRTTAEPPSMPPYEHCAGSRPEGFAEAGNGFLSRLDLRLDPATAGWTVGRPGGGQEMRGWFGFADGREPDPYSLLLAADALPPTPFDLGIPGWVPTVELTVHVRRRPAPGPLRISVVTRNLASGFLEEDGEIWDAEDRLVAQSRQLARLRDGA
ncbi:thioesterase family protein [Streptomyces sp. AV19]|uniref:thioesterase family protein n=1 Tax=Streptomyces sp. AV19 TaxID=2793068 RepID=UPI0018FF023B|nr:thioesterase family protein [Streptomyces sp. AV19]MBH1933864.1 thioesterase family protein [Streptomyces sp. AV19]MDG4535648.1 thioesterase family protein [Streptomyces sp. AV19]